MTSLTFHGAAQQVTGSCYLINTGRHRLLLECGNRQGMDRRENEYDAPFDFDPHAIDAVVISHTHIDHSGLVPLLVKAGFTGPVYATPATRDLLPVMYRDAASLLRSDIERKNRRLLRAGKAPLELPYDMADVDGALQQIEGIDYGSRRQILPDIELRFLNAGHILGSAIVELWLDDGEANKKLVFTGDLGNASAPLMRDPAAVAEADILLLESTYGDRKHRTIDATLEELKEVIDRGARDGGNILIPAFAVGRTQDLIYWLGKIYRDGGLKDYRVFIDSPMAIQVSEIYARHYREFNEDDPDFRHFIKQGWDSWLPGLTYTQIPEESMALNRISDGAIIIAGSGMCTGGRILHHLKHNLWREKTDVVFVGYQAVGTLGRTLVDGASMVRIFGEDIAVRAQIHTLGGLSAHAGQDQLLDWAGGFRPPLPQLCLVHGELRAMQALQQRLIESRHWQARIPGIGETIHF